MFNSSEFKCLFCNKNIYDDILNQLRQGMMKMMTKELELKNVSKKKRSIKWTPYKW